jgi:hypothetical protein
MKRIMLAVAVLFLVGSQDMAKFEIRALAGFNFANTDAPEGTDASAKVGYQFGGHILIGNKFHFLMVKDLWR